MVALNDRMAGVFHALGDPTRLVILERLAKKSQSVSELAEPFDMALPSFLQHLRILEEKGLISSEKKGRVRVCRLNARSLKKPEEWLVKRRELWERRLDRLDEYLLKLKGDENV